MVARRIEEAVAAVGERERVIASTDCGFGTFTNREWVIEPAVWLKLNSIREGADIASARLWGKKSGGRKFRHSLCSRHPEGATPALSRGTPRRVRAWAVHPSRPASPGTSG